MTDIVDPRTRSLMMSRIKGKNTAIELYIRKSLFQRGYRYRIHNTKLPGKPDIVLSKFRAAIFVNGCFWHGHDCHLFKWPRTREEFWKAKIEGNRQRDASNIELLQNQGYRVLVTWECAIRGKGVSDLESVIDQVESWLKSDVKIRSIP